MKKILLTLSLSTALSTALITTILPTTTVYATEAIAAIAAETEVKAPRSILVDAYCSELDTLRDDLKKHIVKVQLKNKTWIYNSKTDEITPEVEDSKPLSEKARGELTLLTKSIKEQLDLRNSFLDRYFKMRKEEIILCLAKETLESYKDAPSSWFRGQDIEKKLDNAVSGQMDRFLETLLVEVPATPLYMEKGFDIESKDQWAYVANLVLGEEASDQAKHAKSMRPTEVNIFNNTMEGLILSNEDTRAYLATPTMVPGLPKTSNAMFSQGHFQFEYLLATQAAQFRLIDALDTVTDPADPTKKIPAERFKQKETKTLDALYAIREELMDAGMFKPGRKLAIDTYLPNKAVETPAPADAEKAPEGETAVVGTPTDILD